MKRLFLFILSLGILVASCKKDEDLYNDREQLDKDKLLIKEYISKKQLDFNEDPSGVYYHIIEPGNGEKIGLNDSLKANYVGRLLNGKVFDQSRDATFKFKLNEVIRGWSIGIPYIKKGGKIRLIIPSIYAYGPFGQPGIPANSILDFEIELIDVQKN